jgi:hypothetical protein
LYKKELTSERVVKINTIPLASYIKKII